MPGSNIFTGSFNLPAPGPTVGSELVEAAGQYPDIMAKQKEQKLQQEQTKLQNEQLQAQVQNAQQTQAMAKLQLFYRMLNNDPNGIRKSDPAFLSGVSAALKELGVGTDLVHRDPMTGQETMDVDALRALIQGKDISDLSPEEMKSFFSMDKEDRTAFLKARNIDPTKVDPDVLNAHKVISESDVIRLTKDASDDIAKVAAGTSDPAALKAQIAPIISQLQAAGVPTDDLMAQINSPEFQKSVSLMAATKAAELRQIGIKDDAVTHWYEAKTKEAPLLAQSLIGRRDIENQRDLAMVNLRQEQVNQGWANFNEKMTRDQAYIDHLHDVSQSLLVDEAVKFSGADLAFAKAKYASYEKQYSDLKDLMGKYLATPGGAANIPDSLSQQMQNAYGNMTRLEEDMGTISLKFPNLQVGKVGAASGKPSKFKTTLFPVEDLPPLDDGKVYLYSSSRNQYQNPDTGQRYDATTGRPISGGN